MQSLFSVALALLAALWFRWITGKQVEFDRLDNEAKKKD
jgi:hypothetical protein